MSISLRIKELREFLKLNKNLFATSIKVDSSQYSKIENEKLQPTVSLIMEICSIYNVNANWLLNGDETMFKEVEKQDGIRVDKSFTLRTDNSVSIQSIPLYDSEIAAGLVSLFMDHPLTTPIEYIQIPNLPKSDGAIYVRGDSMYPVLKSHDIVIYKEVNDLNNHIYIFGEMYIVCVDNDGDYYTMVKWVHKSELGNDHLKLVSENKHHDAIDIPKNKIKGLAMVKASIRVNSMR